MEAKDLWQCVTPDDWSVRKPVKTNENIFVHKSGQRLVAAESIKINPNKKYIITGDFRLTGATKPGMLYFGFVPCTSDNKEFGIQHVRKYPATQIATVALDAKIGSNQIILKKSISFPTKKGSLVMALNAASDDSDLPNLNLVTVKSIKHEDSRTIITLAKKLTQNVAKNSLVRLHSYGDSFLYAGCAGKTISDQ